MQIRLRQARELVRSRAAAKEAAAAVAAAADTVEGLDDTVVEDETDILDEEVLDDEGPPPSDEDEGPPPSDDDEGPPDGGADEGPPEEIGAAAVASAGPDDDDDADDAGPPPSDDDGERPPSDPPSDSGTASTRGGESRNVAAHHDLHEEASRRALRAKARAKKQREAEMADVTFQPKTNGSGARKARGGKAHERLHNARAVQERAQRAARAREERDAAACSFKPKISAKARASKGQSKHDERFEGLLSVHERLHLARADRELAQQKDPECTFQPKTTSGRAARASPAAFNRLYESSAKSRAKIAEAAAAKKKAEEEAELDGCTFTPKRSHMKGEVVSKEKLVFKSFEGSTQERLYTDGLKLMQKRRDVKCNATEREAKAAALLARKKRRAKKGAKVFSPAWCEAQFKGGETRLRARREAGKAEAIAKKNEAKAKVRSHYFCVPFSSFLSLLVSPFLFFAHICFEGADGRAALCGAGQEDVQIENGGDVRCGAPAGGEAQRA